MKRSPLLLTAALLAATILAASRAQAATPTIASLQQAEDTLFHDQITGNQDALAKDVADELIFVHASGMQQDKAEFLAFAGKVHFKSIEPSNRVFHLYGKVGVSHEVFTIDIGLPHKLTGLTMGVWNWRDGRWQLVAWQTTDIKPPAPK